VRHLNYNHLHYFWVVAKEGTIARAAEVLHLTPQTISGQLRFLEDAIGAKLFQKSGRRLVLTETGQVVFGYADEMFTLSAELMDVVRGRAPTGPIQLTVGVVDVMPKLIAYRILEPALGGPEPVRMTCHEGKFGELLADLAVHKLDIVLADSPVHPGLNVRAFNHLLGESGITLFGSKEHASKYTDGFPDALQGAPMLLPTKTTTLRRSMDQWFDKAGFQPRIAGEFEDSALMKAFGQAGTGIFPSPTAMEAEVQRQYDVHVVGRTEAVVERFYAISPERKLKHPAVIAISDAARGNLFARRGSQ
jgi:LysR family transcriptional activator of nhaA